LLNGSLFTRDFLTQGSAVRLRGRPFMMLQEHAATLTPARNAAADILALERRLSNPVNAASGLTPEDVALMWRTAPPRMPLDPAEELRRLTAGRADPAS
jgi:hypothetical protein